MPLRHPKVRADLEYFDHEIDGDEVVMVRDPIRGTYFKYNALQAAMLRSLDGVRSLDEMVAVLSEQFEAEIPRIAAERFVEHARKQMLLDISSYPVRDAKAAAEVMRALRRQGYRFEGVDVDRDHPVASATALFLGAIVQLRHGRPAAALDYLSAVLELEPENLRARTLLDAIQTAYIKALAGPTTEYPTLVLFDPTRLLAFCERAFGRFVFHRFAWFALLALIGLAAYCYSITDYRALEVSAIDVAIATVLTLVHFLLHELAHGFACYHYGGEVREIGIIFFFYVRPAPYCDTSSSYLFKHRGQQIGVQMAGALLSLIFCCVLFVIVAVLHPSLFIYQAALLILWISVIVTFIDFVPFTKSDGYYALCDYLRLPNLRERSFKLLKSTLGAGLLGLPANDEPMTAWRRVVFCAFAVCSMLFTALLIYQGMFRLLAPTIEQLRGIGLIAAIALAAYAVRERVFYPIGRLGALIVRERRRVFARKRLPWLAALAIAASAPWWIERPIHVDAELVLAPRQRVDVRATVPGRIARVLVREGDRVRAGQPMFELVDEELALAARTTEAALAQVEAQLAALHRGTRPEQLAVAATSVMRSRAEHSRASQRARVATALASDGLGPAADAEVAAGGAATSSALAAAVGWQRAMLVAGPRAEDIAATEARRDRLRAQLDHVRGELAQLTVASPIDGVVATKHLADRAHARVERGELLTEVHDASAFVAELALSPAAPLDELRAGDAVELRIEGAPSQALHGALDRVRDVTTTSAAVIATTTPIAMTNGRAGMVGHARVYGERRSLAYARLYLPLAQLLRVRLWGVL